jgi:hypothetical protein
MPSVTCCGIAGNWNTGRSLPCGTNDEDVGRTKMTELFGVHLAAPESVPADVLTEETVYELRWLRQ